MRSNLRLISMFVSLLMIVGSFSGMALALDPLDGGDAEADPDRDGLDNAKEFVYGTDPNDPDSDGAGAFDGWEVWYDQHRAVDVDGFPLISSTYHFDANNPLDEGIVANVHQIIQVRDNDASVNVNDPDGDGWNNYHEYIVGSDPTNPNTDQDCYDLDSADPDPLVSNGGIDTPEDRPNGNGGGGSGEGIGLAAMEG